MPCFGREGLGMGHLGLERGTEVRRAGENAYFTGSGGAGGDAAGDGDPLAEVAGEIQARGRGFDPLNELLHRSITDVVLGDGAAELDYVLEHRRTTDPEEA